jgi:8-oxo-dGTP pyrophosphatase MutT (NUDIX family)
MGERLRRAASLIAVRDADGAPEVLVIERSRRSRFLPGYVAFPGGSVEPGDASLARRWFGSADEAARACAIRELIEEVGLCPAPDGLAPAPAVTPDSVQTWGWEPDRLPLLARWVAPEDVPVRFDAEFFGVRAPAALEPVADGREAVAAWWVSPGRLLEEWDAGDRLLFWPTYFTVRALARCSDAGELLALRFETREPDEDELARLPRSVFWQEEA